MGRNRNVAAIEPHPLPQHRLGGLRVDWGLANRHGFSQVHSTASATSASAPQPKPTPNRQDKAGQHRGAGKNAPGIGVAGLGSFVHAEKLSDFVIQVHSSGCQRDRAQGTHR